MCKLYYINRQRAPAPISLETESAIFKNVNIKSGYFEKKTQ